MRGFARIAKDMHREMADGACDARAIKVEDGESGSLDGFPSIHFHTVDDSVVILATKPIAARRLAQRAGDQMMRLTAVDRVDFLSPNTKGSKLVRDGVIPVGKIIDLATKGVDGVHPVAAVLWQHSHRPVERCSRCFDPVPDRRAQ